MFVQVYSGLDFSFLEDITNGMKGWVDEVNAEGGGASATGGGNNLGIQAGALWGFRLDKSNSLALDLASIFTFGNDVNATYAGGSGTIKTSPYLMSASLDYTLDIAKSKGGRTYITAGAGWYHTIVDYDFEETTSPTFLGGSFSGDTIGGTLGVGEELSLGGSWGLDLSVKGRYANFNKVSADSATSFDGTGPSSLAVTDALSPGHIILLPITNATLDSGVPNLHYATVDYSGIDAKVALNLYF
jgi:hypothetical protein